MTVNDVETVIRLLLLKHGKRSESTHVPHLQRKLMHSSNSSRLFTAFISTVRPCKMVAHPSSVFLFQGRVGTAGYKLWCKAVSMLYRV